MPKIIEIETGLPMDPTYYKVGGKDKETGKIVTEIKDMSVEFENGVHVQYDIYVEDKLYASWINTPVRVRYETEDGE